MAKMKKCPVCGVGVKLENLETHIKKVHPRVNVKAYLSDDDVTVIKVAKKKEKKAAKPFEEQERRRWMIAGALIIVVVIPLIFIFSSTTPIGPGCDLIGEEATTFRIGDVEGNVYDLNEQIGQKQLIVLEFFNTDCPWCEVMAPQLGDLHEYYGWGETVGFVSMSSSAGDSVQSVRDFRDSYAEGTNMTYIHDSSHSLAGDYCVSATPTTVFIDDSGKIVKWSEGAKNFDQMVTIIDNLLQG